MMKITNIIFVIIIPVLFLFSCSKNKTQMLEETERDKISDAGKKFNIPFEKRELPDLETSPTLPVTLEYAFNSNGEIESSYLEWRASIERVPQAKALKNPNLDFTFLFSPENLKSFNTFYYGISLMLSQEIPGAGKRDARADAALKDSMVYGERFRGSKYSLQKKVVQAYADLAFNYEIKQILSDSIDLLNKSYDIALHRYHGMDEGNLSDLQRFEIENQNLKTELRSVDILNDKYKASLNGVLNRSPESNFGRCVIPELKLPEMNMDELFSKAVKNSPALLEVQKEIDARGAVVVLADLEKKPDYNISGGVDGLITPVLSMGIDLPVYRKRIRAQIDEAMIMKESSEAKYRAVKSDTLANIVISVIQVRDAERIINDYNKKIIPMVNELLDSQMARYGSGGGDYLEVVDTQRLLLDFKRIILLAKYARIKYLAELEEIIGEDLFNFIPEGFSDAEQSK